ncbi:unnamed protein product [Calypogeia fissa]
MVYSSTGLDLHLFLCLELWAFGVSCISPNSPHFAASNAKQIKQWRRQSLTMVGRSGIENGDAQFTIVHTMQSAAHSKFNKFNKFKIIKVKRPKNTATILDLMKNPVSTLLMNVKYCHS